MVSLRFRFTTTPTVEQHCVCGYTVDAASPAPGTPDDAIPKVDDFTMCLRCARVYQFTEGLQLRGPLQRCEVPPDVLDAAAQLEGFLEREGKP